MTIQYLKTNIITNVNLKKQLEFMNLKFKYKSKTKLENESL